MGLALRGAADHLGLSPEEVVLLTARGMKAPEGLESCACAQLHGPDVPVMKERMPLGERLRMVKAFDAFVTGLAGGGPYRVYLPHTVAPAYQLLATHPLCEGFSFLEEGMINYRAPDDLRRSVYFPIRRMPLLHRWALRGRLGLAMPFDRRAHAGYALGAGSFARTGVKAIRVSSPLAAQKPLPMTSDVLCCFTPTSLLHRLPDGPHRWSAASRLLARALGRSKGRVYLKFHPGELPEHEHAVRQVFDAEGVPCTVLPKDASAELFLLEHPCRLVHFGSSVALYASMLGVPVLNALGLLEGAERDILAQWRRTLDGLSIRIEDSDFATAWGGPS